MALRKLLSSGVKLIPSARCDGIKIWKFIALNPKSWIESVAIERTTTLLETSLMRDNWLFVMCVEYMLIHFSFLTNGIISPDNYGTVRTRSKPRMKSCLQKQTVDTRPIRNRFPHHLHSICYFLFHSSVRCERWSGLISCSYPIDPVQNRNG